MSDQLSRRQFVKAAKGFIAGAASVGSVSLTSYLVSSVAMVRPAYAVTPVGLVLLRCYGSETEARYLDGLTAIGKVQLSFNVGGKYSGTIWKEYHVITNEGLKVGFECQGHIPGNRWLDGVTATGEVKLAPYWDYRGGQYSGTQWTTYTEDDIWTGVFCLGKGAGYSRWLDGITANNTVRLAPQLGGGYTGTWWRLDPFW